MENINFKEKAKEVIAKCEKYGFMDRKIAPYGFGITVRDFVRNWRDYDNFTDGSKEVMQDELRGFLPIIEHWIAVENEPKITVQIITGKKKRQIAKYPMSFADMLIADNMARAI